MIERKTFYLMTIVVTKHDVIQYFAKNPKYKKVNGFKDMKVEIYI